MRAHTTGSSFSRFVFDQVAADKFDQFCRQDSAKHAGNFRDFGEVYRHDRHAARLECVLRIIKVIADRWIERADEFTRTGKYRRPAWWRGGYAQSA